MIPVSRAYSEVQLGLAMAAAVRRDGQAPKLARGPYSAPTHVIAARRDEVARLIATGMTKQQVADALGVSRSTVESDWRAIRRVGAA